MKTIRDVTDLKDKKVLLRVDFNVPVGEKNQIKESSKITKQKETLDWLLGHGARIVLVSHITSLPSFGDLVPQLHILLGYELNFIKSVADIGPYLNHYSGPALLDNLRQNEGEEKNDQEFCKKLAAGFDLYINNAFGECHRDYASVSGITKFLPSFAGFLIEEETAQLRKGIEASSKGKVIIMGGAKASSKVPVIKNIIDKSEKILVGGVVANDILKAKGIDVGESIVDDNLAEVLNGLDLDNPRLVIPEDYNISEGKILDIGDKTIESYKRIISEASMIIWNGPMGLFERSGFDKGTNEIAKAVSESGAYKIIGGGDTVAAIDKINLSSSFDFISTGGGAMLEFLAGNELPGLKVLGYYK